MRVALVLMVVLLALLVAAPVLAQTGPPGPQEAHFEGFSRHTNPNPPGTVIDGRGLVTALFPPMITDFVHNEYTWEMLNLVSQGSVLKDSVYYTTYTVVNGLNPATFTVYEDPSQDARPTYYFCPNSLPDNVYTDGAVYLRGHFTDYKTSFDIHADNYGQGTFRGDVNWDSGTHIGDIPIGHRGAWQFGGTSVSPYSCIPVALGYEEAMTGIIYQEITPAAPTTWGKLHRLYR